MARFIIYVYIASLLACRAQSNDEKIINTTKKIITALHNKDLELFKDKIGLDDLNIIGKDDEMVRTDFENLSSVIAKDSLNFYFKQIVVPNEINDIGQKTITLKIPFAIDEDSIFKGAYLLLYFGPPQINPLDKNSGYKIIYRRR